MRKESKKKKEKKFLGYTPFTKKWVEQSHKWALLMKELYSRGRLDAALF